MFRAYSHKVQYYETDQMGIVHHSNYIRWFEEARTDLMEQFGFGYDKAESCGIRIPVLEVSCRFISMVRYGEEVRITQKMEPFNGVRMMLSYRITDAATGQLRASGESRHCFLDGQNRPVSLSRLNPDLFARFKALEDLGYVGTLPDDVLPDR